MQRYLLWWGITLIVTAVASSSAIAADLDVYIGYRLPENPDLRADAISLESKCLNSRLIALQACRESDAGCRKDAETSFRICVSNRVEFWAASTNYCLANGAMRDKGVQRLLKLTLDQALDREFDRDFPNLARSGRYSPIGWRIFRGRPALAPGVRHPDQSVCTRYPDLHDNIVHNDNNITQRPDQSLWGRICAEVMDYEPDTCD